MESRFENIRKNIYSKYDEETLKGFRLWLLNFFFKNSDYAFVKIERLKKSS